MRAAFVVVGWMLVRGTPTPELPVSHRVWTPGALMEAEVGESGVRLAPTSGAPWVIDVSISTWGRDGHLVPAATERITASSCEAGATCRVERSLGGGLTGWWAPAAEGIEHGWTLDREPEGTGDVVLDLSFGEFDALVNEDATSALLVCGTTRIAYEGLKAWDATGRALPATLEDQPGGLRVHVEIEGAVFPVQIDPVFREADLLKDLPDNGRSFRTEAGGDFDGDGYDDVVLAYVDGTLQLFTGSTTSPVESQTITGPSPVGLGIWPAIGLASGDIDGDGYDDLVVGAPNHDDATDDGSVHVYRGSGSGLETTPSWVFYGYDSSVGYGEHMAVGDVDGDGFEDIALWSSKNNGGTGRVFVHLGSVAGPDADPHVSLHFNSDKLHITLADLDGDSYDDLVVGDPWSPDEAVLVYAGSPAGTSTTPTWTIEPDPSVMDGDFGGALGAGDVDGDGIEDLVVAAPGASGGGSVFVHPGSALGPAPIASHRIDGTFQASRLGWALVVHDLDGDGIDDLVLSDRASTVDKDGDDDFAKQDWLQVHYGDPNGPELSPTWVARSAGEGTFDLGNMGDINGDGRGDLVVATNDSSPYHSSVQVHFGSVDRTSGTMAPTWWSTKMNYGAAMEGGGDVNGDGFDDLLVAAPETRVNGSAMQGAHAQLALHLGSASGLTPTSAWTPSDPTGSGSGFGFDIAYAGDVNGDGYDDVVVSAPAQSAPVAFEDDHGAVYVYYGSATGLPDDPDAAFYGDKEWERFGMDVSGAGDINGDGYDDIVVGSPEHTRVLDIVGETTYLFGSAAGIGAGVPSVQIRGVGDKGWGAGVWMGDLDGDDLADVAVVGDYNNKIKVDLSSATGVGWTATLPSHIGDGASVVMSDVNGDGFQDVIGATPNGGKGRVEVFHGGPLGPTALNWQTTGQVANQRYGSGVRPAGDLNDDGYDDVVVRTVGPAERSTVEVFLGSPTGLATSPMWESPRAWREGTYATGAGDVDGDGFDDLALSNASAIWILYGSATGLDDRL